MGIQRAATLYFDNGTTVDSGVGIDIRLLNSTQPSADTSGQVNWTHTNDDVGRVLRPATSNNTSQNVGATAGYGYALRVSEDMTPADDTNCNVLLRGATYTVGFKATLNQSGGTYAGGSYGPQFEVALWRWNPSSNVGALIGTGNNASAITWNYTPATGDLGAQKNISVNVTVGSDVEFAQGEVLLIELGLNTKTVPNPSLGTATWTCNFGIGYSNADIAFDAGEGIRQSCAFSNTAVGVGAATRAFEVGIGRTPVGSGAATFSRSVVAAKSFSLVGKGIVTHTKAVTPTNFDLAGKGAVDGRIEIPIDEIPSGGGGGTTVRPVFGHFE